MGFNTVNGKYCCNLFLEHKGLKGLKSFNTVNGKYCCNNEKFKTINDAGSFNTVNGKYCCNVEKAFEDAKTKDRFQYRKR